MLEISESRYKKIEAENKCRKGQLKMVNKYIEKIKKTYLGRYTSGVFYELFQKLDCWADDFTFEHFKTGVFAEPKSGPCAVSKR